MDIWAHSGARYLAMGVAGAAALVLLWCGALALIPRPADADDAAGFRSRDAFVAAYESVVPGRTPASQLSRLGFDPHAPGARTLSYLGALEYFMPRDSAGFDRLDPAMRACLEARDRCAAYIFDIANMPFEVTMLALDGRVTFKEVTSRPVIAANGARVIDAR